MFLAHFHIHVHNLYSSYCNCIWIQLQIQGQTIDFIKHNAQCARKTALRRCQSLTNLRDRAIPSAVKGQVPQ